MLEIDWRDRLIQANESLFLRQLGGRNYSPGRPAVGDGWRDLVEIAVKRIRRAAQDYRILISQIKSTSGSVRISWDPAGPLPAGNAAAIEHAAALARARSLCTCQVCGTVGSLWRCGELMATACDEHGAGVPEPIPPGFENFHVVPEFENGRPQAIWCRRYDRKRDRFIEVDASSGGVARPAMLVSAHSGLCGSKAGVTGGGPAARFIMNQE
jgi:hypothetical protein